MTRWVRWDARPARVAHAIHDAWAKLMPAGDVRACVAPQTHLCGFGNDTVKVVFAGARVSE